MMKLVISFDQIGINPEFQDIESATDMVFDFLENQFPEWDISEVFDIDNIDWDFDNMEIHILMGIID